MPRKNAIIACKGIPNQSKAGTHGMSHMGAGFVCMGLFPRPRADKIIQQDPRLQKREKRRGSY